MGTFNESLTRMRRFLRDPDGLIWLDEDIRLYWNDSQLEVADKIGFIERVNAYAYPPIWTWGYQWDWEVQYIDGDKLQILNNWPTRNMIVSYPWEPGYYLDSMDTPDDGSRFTHPWEVGYCSPADVVKIPLHAKFHKGKFVAYDELQIDATTEREVSENDPYYKTRSSDPTAYYRPNEYENTMVLYPRPSAIVWDEANLLLDDASESFTDSSESYSFGIANGGTGYHYLDVLTLVQTGGSGCTILVSGVLPGMGIITGVTLLTNGTGYSTATDLSTTGGYGSGCKLNLTITTETGIISYQDDSFDESDTGIIFDRIDAEDHLFMIFESMPDDVDDDDATWDDDMGFWPPYMIPVVEATTLSRCYGADTDGFIPSLRDYWELRKKIGVEAIKLFKLNRLTDRDFRLGGTIRPDRSEHPRLPAGYPRQYP